MLREVHYHCIRRSVEIPMPHIHIHNELITNITQLCLRLCRAEPVLIIISDAYNAFEKASQATYPSMASTLLHYQTLFQIYTSRLGPVARDRDEYEVAFGLILCFARHTFEACHQPVNMINLLAEEATRDIQGEMPLLKLYNTTWSSMLNSQCVK